MREGWEIRRLGEACTLIMGQSPASSTYNSQGNGMPFFQGCADFGSITPSITTYCSSPNKVAEIDDVLMSVRAPIGTLNIANVRCCIGRGLAAIRQKEGVSTYKYLYYFISKSKKRLQDLGTGATFKAIGKETLTNFPIPVPPIQEQEKIVAELDCLTGIIEKKKQQLEELDKLAQSIFYDMFGDPIVNEKGWKKSTIGDTCVITCGQDYKSVADVNGPYPIYGTGGIMGRASQFRCPKDTVIIGRKGNINNPIYVAEPFWNVDTAFGVTPNSKVLNPKYFYFFCLDYDFTQHDVSVTIPSLRRTDILKIKVPTPLLDLQNEFAKKIEAIDRQKELVKRSIVETETLFNSRMDYWFN